MKHVLVISYYFPPSGGPGVQRSLKFVKYLRSFGWEPTVLTVEPEYASYPDLDPELLSDIPPGVLVKRTRSRDPYSAYARWIGARKKDAVGVGFLAAGKPGWREKTARWIRANLFVPDARVGWVSFAKKEALNLAETNHFDAMVSTGPPHSAHLICLELKEKLGLPWLLDIRDAWPDDSYTHLLPSTGLARRKDARLRKRVFDASDMLVTVSPSILKSSIRWTNTDADVIYNGFDADDFEGVTAEKSDFFTIVHAGNMSAERNPGALWDALLRVQERLPKLRVHLIGNVGPTVLESVDRLGLSEFVRQTSYVSHSGALAHMAGAELLLLPVNRVPDSRGIITGKVFEYLGSGRPILCLAPPDGDAAEIIRRSGGGSTFDYEDVDGVVSDLERHYSAWKEGSRLSGATAESAGEYSRKSQTGKLADLLDQIAEIKPIV
jgi:glycosyltransferase involved in cell wall biosynthesis